ncbi:hypothetical protein KKH15_02780 [Patescibacteria group bacterium]|nr:hypothetical protein [Patescibacteria group bacterium]MBU1754742.1 hypothetical protein [Patescibacteria group bacterium]
MKSILILIAVVLVALAGYFVFTNRAAAPISPATESETEADSGDSFAATVVYSDEGFSPSNVNLAVGETVRFVNTSSGKMWVGVDDHPTHTKYDGTSTREHCADGKATNGTFDQCEAVPAGAYWQYTFNTEGVWAYHNHVQSSFGGTITVSK